MAGNSQEILATSVKVMRRVLGTHFEVVSVRRKRRSDRFHYGQRRLVPYRHQEGQNGIWGLLSHQKTFPISDDRALLGWKDGRWAYEEVTGLMRKFDVTSATIPLKKVSSREVRKVPLLADSQHKGSNSSHRVWSEGKKWFGWHGRRRVGAEQWSGLQQEASSSWQSGRLLNMVWRRSDDDNDTQSWRDDKE